jgi:hypothetical protein
MAPREYDGNTGTITPSVRHAHLIGRPCPHYPDDERGDPGFDVRNFTSRSLVRIVPQRLG